MSKPAGSSTVTRKVATGARPTKGIAVSSWQLASGTWKARAKFVDAEGDFLEVVRWANTQAEAERKAHSDVLAGLQVFRVSAAILEAERGRYPA